MRDSKNILGTAERTPLDEVLAALRDKVYDREILRAALHLRGSEQDALFALARERRDQCFPRRQVEVRSVIEISNVCHQDCSYCNMGRKNKNKTYVMEEECVLELTRHLHEKGRRVLMFQSGEISAPSFVRHVSACVRGIKENFSDMIVILCLGNMKREQYQELRDAGADRYILKFETSNPDHYRRMKPLDTLDKRLECLEALIDAGFGTGSGNITGLPGQTMDDIIGDLELIHRYPLTMSSSTVFIPGEETVLHGEPMGEVDVTLNTMALIRIMNPNRLMPTTSSLDRARKGAQVAGLLAGANTVTIHDGTPDHLKALFPIYSINRITPNIEHMSNIVKQAGMNMPGE